MVRVKICGITNLEDALAAVEAGADALGFNFWRGSKRFIAPEEARDIVGRLPAPVLAVGVFVNEELEEVERAAELSGVGALQLHGDETPDYCRRLGGRHVIKALRVGDGFEPEEAARYSAQALLLDAFCADGRGGTGKSFDWSVARRVRALVPRLYLAGGLTPDNAAEAVRTVAPFALDVCSGVESAPGRKDPARMRELITAVRRAARETREE